MRQLSKVAELLSRTATIGQDEIAVLGSTITDVYKHVAPAKTK